MAETKPVDVLPRLTRQQGADDAPEGFTWDEAGAWFVGWNACADHHRAAVAELVAADRLLDRTQEAYDRASAGRICHDLWADVLAARARRAAALAAFGGAA